MLKLNIWEERRAEEEQPWNARPKRQNRKSIIGLSADLRTCVCVCVCVWGGVLGSKATSSSRGPGLCASMKRPCEDSSSAVEDVDVGRVCPGHIKASYRRSASPSSQMMERKRRRGVIEKRRRDRINNSLWELRRLVPTAVERQGSAKLEKAEILQMAVDHLRLLQAGSLGVHTLALDFLSLGFRECVTEVSRYLSAVEGLDLCDPLQARLLSHLAMASHPPPFPWAAAVRPPYGLNVLSPPPDACGASQRPVEMVQRSFAVASTSSSSSRPYRPWGAEVGAF